jgi:two-component system, NtrC family, sensor kinase
MSAKKLIEESRVIELEQNLKTERMARQMAEDLIGTMTTEIYHTHESLRTRCRELDFLNEISSGFDGTLNLSESIRRFLSVSTQFLEWPIGHVYIRSKKHPENILSSGLWSGPSLETSQSFISSRSNRNLKTGEGLPGAVFRDREIIWSDNYWTDSLPASGAKRFQTTLGVPLILNHSVIAVFEYFHFDDLPKDSRKIEILNIGVKQLARLIEQKETQKELFDNYKVLSEAKEQLVQSEKMASLGIITAGIAHEINNPLSYVLSNIEVLEDYLQQISLFHSPLTSREKREEMKIERVLNDLSPLISETLSGAERVRDIVRGLQSFSHLKPTAKNDFDLNECIHESIKLLSNEIKYRCTLKINLGLIPKLNGFSNQITQVITNLALNSLQAMDGFFGNLEIRTFLNAETSAVHLIVSDSGKGIQPEHLQQIFTPFFSTKPVGKGTGLGLSISYGIIKAHRGEIKVRSEPNVKTEFELIFPV